MFSVRGFITVMLRSAFIVAFLSIPRPVVAFTGFKHWSRKALYHKIDLCTQSCYSQIIPGLYLSNARAAADKAVLRYLNITHVLTIETHRLPKSTFENTNIDTLFIRAYDNPQTNLLPYFPMANAFIEEGLQKGNVLVHCHFGVSRSATLVIAYLMKRYKLTFDQAFSYVRQRRRFINPNPGFVNQLKEYQRMKYDVNGFHRFEAYMNVNARKHRYKIASLAAVMVGLLVPIVVLVLFWLILDLWY
ncbi:dual specificity protein phosphatase MPK-4-like [Achroia grisella]|uniref:dual specificity protein phosphatase MPK-4-like n=1 Tax=Achroia grisella TaxID=688607 RepID=UPI0027D221BE|nr:dual specificity protein phosphatase MPK-4-like [Achroia grisella]